EVPLRSSRDPEKEQTRASFKRGFRPAQAQTLPKHATFQMLSRCRLTLIKTHTRPGKRNPPLRAGEGSPSRAHRVCAPRQARVVLAPRGAEDGWALSDTPPRALPAIAQRGLRDEPTATSERSMLCAI